MNTTTTLAASLLDGVHETQHAFRAALDALARPGQVRRIGAPLPGVALGGAMARLLLTLCDDETPVWWQDRDTVLQSWLRFHTSAALADRSMLASFAVITDIGRAPVLADFSVGSAAAPEFSSTLLIELPALAGGPALDWRGPGIEVTQCVKLQGLPADFWTQWQANQASFPQGVDIIFTCDEHAIGLPRTTQVGRAGGV